MDSDAFTEEMIHTFIRYFETIDRESTQSEAREGEREMLPNDSFRDPAPSREADEAFGAAKVQSFIVGFNKVRSYPTESPSHF